VDKVFFTKLVYYLCFTNVCSIGEADISIVNTRQVTGLKRSEIRNAAIDQCEDLVQPIFITSIRAHSCILCLGDIEM